MLLFCIINSSMNTTLEFQKVLSMYENKNKYRMTTNDDLLDDFMEELEDLEPTSEEKNLAMLAHLSALSGFVVPFGNLLGPLVVWLLKKEESDYIAEHAKEALNFQLTIFLTSIMAIVLFVLFTVSMEIIGLFIGMGLMVIGSLLWLIFTIIGGVRASENKIYRYPFSFRFIS